MKTIHKSILVLGVAAISAAAHLAYADLVNDVPSCYGAFHLTSQPQIPNKLVYVLIDQTVQLDPDLQQSVINNINRMIQPGSKFVIAEFSAFSQGRYLHVLHTGVVETPMDEAAYDNIPITKAPTIRACFGQQQSFAQKMADSTAKQVMQSSSSLLAQSDIIAAIQNVGQALRADTAKNKVLFLVTDALENSSITSFYSHKRVRDVNPGVELGKVKASHMLADLGGSKVYMLGCALMPATNTGTPSERNAYRDPKTLQDLRAFWQGYFQNSNAFLVEFGEPALVNPVAY